MALVNIKIEGIPYQVEAGLTILEGTWVEEFYAIGMNKENTALLEAVNGALKELSEDGTLASIVAKYIPAE